MFETIIQITLQIMILNGNIHNRFLSFSNSCKCISILNEGQQIRWKALRVVLNSHTGNYMGTVPSIFKVLKCCAKGGEVFDLTWWVWVSALGAGLNMLFQWFRIWVDARLVQESWFEYAPHWKLCIAGV